jgi:hypothetical protein
MKHKKKIIVSIITVLLGLGVIFGNKTKIKYYLDQAVELISNFDLTEENQSTD